MGTGRADLCRAVCKSVNGRADADWTPDWPIVHIASQPDRDQRSALTGRSVRVGRVPGAVGQGESGHAAGAHLATGGIRPLRSPVTEDKPDEPGNASIGDDGTCWMPEGLLGYGWREGGRASGENGRTRVAALLHSSSSSLSSMSSRMASSPRWSITSLKRSMAALRAVSPCLSISRDSKTSRISCF